MDRRDLGSDLEQLGRSRAGRAFTESNERVTQVGPETKGLLKTHGGFAGKILGHVRLNHNTFRGASVDLLTPLKYQRAQPTREFGFSREKCVSHPNLSCSSSWAVTTGLPKE